jgi:hypothetical protein
MVDVIVYACRLDCFQLETSVNADEYDQIVFVVVVVVVVVVLLLM